MLPFFSLLSMLSIGLYFLLMLYLHQSQKDYNPVYHAVSNYGVGKTEKLFFASACFSILASLSLAMALYLWDYAFSFKTIAITLLIVRSISLLGVMFFPTDIEKKEKTKRGRLHLLFAVIQFVAIAIFVFNIADFLIPVIQHNYRMLLGGLKYIVKCALIFLVLSMIVPNLKKYFGLFERVFLYSSALYFFLIALLLF